MLTPVLQVHSTLGAQGWTLVEAEGSERANTPPGSVGLYERAGKRAWLVQRGQRFELVEVAP